MVGGKLLKGRTYGPIRAIGEELDAQIKWKNKTKVATLIKDDHTITMQAGSKVVTVNGIKILMDASVHLEDGRIYLPMRYVSEALGELIRWDKGRQYAVLGDEYREHLFIYVQPIFFRDAIEILDKEISNSGNDYTEMTDASYLDYSYPSQKSMTITSTKVVWEEDVYLTQEASLVKKNGKWVVTSINESTELYRP
ncbi:copper amine oxidase N-terminal domain-containing protein [Lysinibacillus yapensis]|uniref:Copper amine oxidase N-terminal domain-containing protein n=1 Tax=Ureibacillus yapensis TaxID=2304605 RepID=A0A396SAG8_9BACL|nr:copper amine oxidase N-terminal domain-containing protein [Lysinibacillus yapensis]RHW38331.1 copper amine oxidase N-terminal domain-containing protein [Lysinibacillus yapensis]